MIARIEALLRNNEAFVEDHLPRPELLRPPFAGQPQTSMINHDAAMQEVCKFHPGVIA